ncbi:MAG: exodeoxyribonuclease I [Stagnimonas sp.]|nr:exodeoxyribonuclease I [Stagnimonas sp.]
MNAPTSFLWHDYETFGVDPARDRPSQFAARRTNAALEPVGEPISLFCQPVIDVLPHPDAVLLTGISPQRARDEGLPEYGFAEAIHKEMMVTGTCAVGFNTLRFDDEVTRNLFWRNFHEPYLREWFGGNSRWDLIDVMRLWHALRPAGLQWPKREDGSTSFKLQHLTAANGLAHEHAHEALSDVDATIGLARRLREAQPRLWEHALKLRDKHFVRTLLNVQQMTPLVHVSSKIPAARGCLAVIAPLAQHPTNSNAVITFDLSVDPTELLELDADELRERVFASDDDLPDGLSRIPLKGVHANKSPMLSPLGTLDAATAERWGIDLARCQQHRDLLLTVREALAEKVRAVFTAPEFEEQDAELSLYAGFMPDVDKPLLAKVRDASADALWNYQGQFRDARLNTLLFRYRARHWPDRLSEDEVSEWREFVQGKLQFDTGLAGLTMESYEQLIEARLFIATTPEQRGLLQKLKDWPIESGLSRLLGR